MTHSLQITEMLVPTSKYEIKCPYEMKPTKLTCHNTYNNASAMAEVSYMIGNNNQVSFHYAVDNYRAVKGIPTNRNAYHAGDGRNGKGNRESIAVEVCYSKSEGEKFDKSLDNALMLFATLMKEHSIPSSEIYYHQNWSGKYCPHRQLDQGITISKFRNMVQNRYNEMYSGGNVTVTPITPSGKSYNVGDVVTINGVYTSSGSDKMYKPSKTSGKITRIIKGARNPYLLENGNIGWVNDSCIVSGGSSNSISKSIDTIAQEVLAGKWGNGDTRKNRLIAAGYDYNVIQNRVNELAKGGTSTPSVPKKSITQVAQEVLAGKYGNGDERKQKLAAEGYNYSEVQAKVNELSGSKPVSKPKKSIGTIAQEVLAGKWGNGDTRRQKLEAEGYNYSEVQAEVNRLAKGGTSTPSVPKKSITQVAKDVINGKYGNGNARRQKLEAEGYNYSEVQAEVNRLL